MLDRTAIDLKILRVLRRAGDAGRTASDIMNRTGDSRRQVGESLRRMETWHYVTRFACQPVGHLRTRAAWRITNTGADYEAMQRT